MPLSAAMTDHPDAVTSSEARVLTTIMEAVRDDVSELKANVHRMTEAMAQLVRLEVEHQSTRDALGRAFTAHDKFVERFEAAHDSSLRQRKELDDRVQAIEREMPGLREGRKWLIGIASVCLVMLLSALVALVVRAPAPIEIIKSIK